MFPATAALEELDTGLIHFQPQTKNARPGTRERYGSKHERQSADATRHMEKLHTIPSRREARGTERMGVAHHG